MSIIYREWVHKWKEDKVYASCLGTLLEVNDLVELGWFMTNPEATNSVFLLSFHVILFFVINLLQLE